jgi:hypothetical protein
VLAACGGSGGTLSSTQTADVSFKKGEQIVAADDSVFSAANATSNIVGHPQNVAKAKKLLKPLTVASTLKVKPSNDVAGGLVTSLTADLDNTVPGLTTQSGKLDNEAVHRFLLYGGSKPELVFEPKAAKGVGELERLLKGAKANTKVTDQTPPAVAGPLVAQDIKSTRPYWPQLAKRLEALQRSLG